MPSLNRVLLIGTIFRDPELRRLPAGQQVLCDFTVAVTRKKPNKGEEETTYVECTAWGKIAELLATTMGKGSLVYVEARVVQDRWQDKRTGEPRSRLKITADNVQALAPKPPGPKAAAPPPDAGAPDDPSMDDIKF